MYVKVSVRAGQLISIVPETYIQAQADSFQHEAAADRHLTCSKFEGLSNTAKAAE